MNRDMDLVRALMLRAEGVEPMGMAHNVQVEPWSLQEVFEHAEMMTKAGLLKASFSIGPETHLRGLTWEGHDFLDDIRDDGVWSKVKRSLASVGGTASLEVTRQIAVAAVKTQLGLG